MAEQRPFKALVVGSSPTQPTIRLHMRWDSCRALSVLATGQYARVVVSDADCVYGDGGDCPGGVSMAAQRLWP